MSADDDRPKGVAQEASRPAGELPRGSAGHHPGAPAGALPGASADATSGAPRAAGRLFGVGVGPGDPELLTLKARRIIEAAGVVAYPNARHGRSVARQIAAPYLRDEVAEVALTYPVTTEVTDHPGGYEAALIEFYDAAAAQLTEHLDAGRDVAVLCEGDPFFYGSYMYLHERLAPRYETEVVPGVTSFSAAAAAAGTPLAKRDDILTILPGTLPGDVLTARLRASDASVVIKLGRTFEKVRGAAESAGVAASATYVERASSDAERVAALRDVDGKVPYMSLLLVPAAKPAARCTAPGTVAVVGLGPAGADWLTPEAQAELAAADDVVGYATYLARVPHRRGQRRHGSDNRVEAQRARHALELAAAGARVAVVSSGDPGIFAMASAVYEQVECNGLPDVEVRVVPGLVGDAGRRRAGRRTARPRLLRRLAVRPAQAPGRRRAPPRGRRRGRPRARALQPGVADAARPARPRVRDPAPPPRAGHSGRRRARGRIGGRGRDGDDARRRRLRRGCDRHADAAHRRLVDDARHRRRRRVHAAAVPA